MRVAASSGLRAKRRLGVAALSVVLAVGPAWADGPALAPGRETAVDVPGEGGEMLVFLPGNYVPERAWPAVFFFPGQSGVPTTQYLQGVTRGQDFIVVGMPYVFRFGEAPRKTPEEQKAAIDRELANYRAARDWVCANASVDRRRIYLAGVSRGGWTVSILGDMEAPNLAGIVIWVAGRLRSGIVSPAAGAYAGKAVYIGSGENDPNLAAALQARVVYAQCGASVTFEEYAGLGHEMPSGSERQTQWFEAQGRYRHPWTPDADREALREQLHACYKQAMAETDERRREERLAAVAEDPRLSLCGETVARGVWAQLDRLRQGATDPERQAEREFNRLVWREWNMGTLSEMEAVHRGFEQAATAYPATRFGARAGDFARRMLPMLEQARKSYEAAKAEAAKQRTGAPGRHVDVQFPGVSFGN